jgi:hypothetical protein
VGRAAGAVVLEALAVELVLKARLRRAGVLADKLKTHDHKKLYKKLLNIKQQEADEADQRYQSLRLPAMRATLAEALAYSAQVFERWRYMHEEEQRSGVEASMGEMQRAFMALADGM